MKTGSWTCQETQDRLLVANLASRFLLLSFCFTTHERALTSHSKSWLETFNAQGHSLGEQIVALQEKSCCVGLVVLAEDPGSVRSTDAAVLADLISPNEVGYSGSH